MSAAAPTAQTVSVTMNDGRRLTAAQLLEPWQKRKTSALRARKPFEQQWLENQAFAAGQQWLRIMPERSERRLIDIRDELRQQGRSVQEADVLTQNLWTALGILYSDDWRPELLAYRPDEETTEYTDGLNKWFGWGWDEEWKGDSVLFDLLITLGVIGTGAIQPRYDRTRGQFLGQVPHAPTGGHTYQDGQGQEQHVPEGMPILDETAARAFVADKRYYGENPNLRPLKEGQIRWPVLTGWNLLTPPAMENSDDFPWEIIVRPAQLDTLVDTYGDVARSVQAEEMEAMTVLGLRDISPGATGGTSRTGGAGKLEDAALLYTGYAKPCGDYPQGQTVVWAGETPLDVKQGLPLTDGSKGPRSGITYFRYWKVRGRFWGRALIEAGIGPQKTRNKRLSQIDEIIDRGGPKTYGNEGDLDNMPSGLMMEFVELKQGAAKPLIDPGIGPGPWMKDSILQCDSDIESGMGLHETSLGATAPAGTPYAAIAQQAENDKTKIKPVSGPLALGIAEVSRDTVPLMRQWPDNKRALIVGPADRLELAVFTRSQVPAEYLVRPSKTGGLPRSQGAELQKISDLWSAAETCGLTAQDPAAWWDWLRRSMDAGQAQEPPEMNAKSEQMHRAQLENVVMSRTGELLPVAPFDDPQIHIPVHDEQQANLMNAAAEGDQRASLLAEVIERHKQLHVQQQAQNTPPVAPSPMGAPLGPPGMNGAGPPPMAAVPPPVPPAGVPGA